MKLQVRILTFVILSAIACKVIAKARGPIFLYADFVEYDNKIIYGFGNVRIKQNDHLILTDEILYDTKNDLVFASGDVVIYDEQGRISLGKSVIFKDKFNQGLITNFVVKWDDGVLLAASLAEKVDKDHSKLYKASFTPCKVSETCNPIWQISAKNTDIDYEKHNISYKHVFFKIYGVPVFYSPYFSHHTPDAPAKSGILVPSITHSEIKVPFYYRAKPNLDFTFSPRIARNVVIYELEMRHKIDSGSYTLKEHYGSVPYKNKKSHNNYFTALGEFGSEFQPYGFDLNFVSNKAFLQNYYNDGRAYTTSKLYFRNIENENYYTIESLYFRDLKIMDAKPKDPLIAPKIQTKNVIPLSFADDCYLKIESDSLFYNQKQDLNLARSSFLFSLIKDFRSAGGHLVNVDLSSREDLYIYKNLGKEVTALRVIPQLQATWRYPLIRSGIYNSLLLEPIVSGVISPTFEEHYIKKFALIDPSIYELSENNIFSGNRYSGIDYHEFGKRLSYGVNSALMGGDNYFNLFIGQLLHANNKLGKSDKLQNVGSINLNFSNNLELFYKYRKGGDFESIRDEVGGNFRYGKINLTSGLIKLENIKKYYTEGNLTLPKNHLMQGYYNIDYQLTDNWLLGNEMQFDLRGKSMKLISKSIRVTYFKDCVKIGVIFYDNYTYDNKLGVKRTSNKTIAIGLKALNM
jgi:LPS-assembly protein